MKTSTIIVIVIVLLGIALVAWLASDWNDTVDPIDNVLNATSSMTTPQLSVSNFDGLWQTYEDQESLITFSYPEEVTIEENRDRVIVQYLGANTLPNSEITDGFVMGIRTRGYADGVSVAEVAEELFDENAVDRRVIASTSSMTMGGQTVYTFEVEGELGIPLAYVVIPGNDENVIVVDYLLANPAGRNYESVINQILLSLQLQGEDE